MEEIHKIIEHSDVRGKALTLVLCSSGIREGAIEDLRVRNLKPVRIDSNESDGSRRTRTLGRLTVYEGDVSEEYITFITPEAYEGLQSYFDWRREHGETCPSLFLLLLVLHPCIGNRRCCSELVYVLHNLPISLCCIYSICVKVAMTILKEGGSTL
jgi:hypothetical protein